MLVSHAATLGIRRQDLFHLEWRPDLDAQRRIADFLDDQGWSPQCSTERAASGEAAVLKLSAVRRGVVGEQGDVAGDNSRLSVPSLRWRPAGHRAYIPDLVGDSAVVRTIGDLD